MDSISLQAPPAMGSRKSARAFVDHLPANLSDVKVSINVAGCLPTVSFVHEIMLEVVSRRDADRLSFIGASDFVRELICYAADGAEFFGRVCFEDESGYCVSVHAEEILTEMVRESETMGLYGESIDGPSRELIELAELRDAAASESRREKEVALLNSIADQLAERLRDVCQSNHSAPFEACPQCAAVLSLWDDFNDTRRDW